MKMHTALAAKGRDRVLPARRPKAVALAAKGRDGVLAARRPKAVTEFYRLGGPEILVRYW